MDKSELTGDEVAALCRAAYDGRQPAYGVWLPHWPPTLAQLRAGFIPNTEKPRPREGLTEPQETATVADLA
jgi:hypothetical protein